MMELFLAFLRVSLFSFYYEVAIKCCPFDAVCCYNQFTAQKPLNTCEKLGKKWRNATICAEKLLKSSKSVEDNLDKCCYYLTPQECKLDCLESLQSPTLDGNAKMAFTERCERYNRTVEPNSCVSRRNIIAHECFAACLRIGKNYHPPTHCPEMEKNNDWCIGPEVPRTELPMAKRDLKKVLALLKQEKR